ncbi:MAG: hypothetical protein CMF49_07590 [Legionellales bacterium]|nr:hypothetical protein [Legionellales bacterium]|tara:strand:- start:360 stop:662 length:303 start_codon:yes stop_codon:yes gene_type:complete
MQDEKVLLEILGKEFLIKSSAENLDKVNDATKLLQKTVAEIHQAHPHQSLDRKLVLSALTIAADYLDLKNDKLNPQDVIEQQINRIQTQINSAMSITEKC